MIPANVFADDNQRISYQRALRDDFSVVDYVQKPLEEMTREEYRQRQLRMFHLMHARKLAKKNKLIK